MKLVVCVKQVPLIDVELKIARSGTELAGDLAFKMNECDQYALETAVQLKEKHGGKVTVVTLGPDRAKDVLYLSLAKGADEVVHIKDESADALDAYGIARQLSFAVSDMGYDLVLTGAQSDDMGFAQVGITLAEFLGLPHASYVSSIEVGDQVRVGCEIGGGRKQLLELPLPSLLTIQSGIYRLRYTSIRKIAQARTREIKTLSSSDLPSQETEPQGRKVNVAELFFPEKKKTELLSGPVDKVVPRLIELLKDKAKVI